MTLMTLITLIKTLSILISAINVISAISGQVLAPPSPLTLTFYRKRCIVT